MTGIKDLDALAVVRSDTGYVTTISTREGANMEELFLNDLDKEGSITLPLTFKNVKLDYVTVDTISLVSSAITIASDDDEKKAARAAAKAEKADAKLRASIDEKTKEIAEWEQKHAVLTKEHDELKNSSSQREAELNSKIQELNGLLESATSPSEENKKSTDATNAAGNNAGSNTVAGASGEK